MSSVLAVIVFGTANFFAVVPNNTTTFLAFDSTPIVKDYSLRSAVDSAQPVTDVMPKDTTTLPAFDSTPIVKDYSLRSAVDSAQSVTDVVPKDTTTLPAFDSTPTVDDYSLRSAVDSVQPVTNEDAMQLRAKLLGYTYSPGIGAYRRFNGHTWNLARRACEKAGGHMLIINSYDEARVVTKLLLNDKIHTWVGVHDYYEEGQFVTIHGESLAKTGFEKWQSGEPNNVGSGEHCLVLTGRGELCDIPCNYTRPYVCELSRI